MNSMLLEQRVAKQEKLSAPKHSARISVTYIVGSLRDGGTERQVLQLMQHLDRTRFDPSLILMEGVNIERTHGLIDNCFVLGMTQAGSSRWLPRSRSLSKAVYSTAKHLRYLQSQIVHAFLPGPSILGGMPLAWLEFR